MAQRYTATLLTDTCVRFVIDRKHPQIPGPPADIYTATQLSDTRVRFVMKPKDTQIPGPPADTRATETNKTSAQLEEQAERKAPKSKSRCGRVIRTPQKYVPE